MRFNNKVTPMIIAGALAFIVHLMSSSVLADSMRKGCREEEIICIGSGIGGGGGGGVAITAGDLIAIVGNARSMMPSIVAHSLAVLYFLICLYLIYEQLSLFVLKLRSNSKCLVSYRISDLRERTEYLRWW